jgi:uncharacterized membrane protein YfcA
MDKIKKHTMDTQMVIILILVGICAGIMSGLIGVGGGIVIVPALVYILGFSQLDAQGTSLAMILFPVGILGVMQYYKQGHVDFNIVLILALGFVLGSFIGSKISIFILSQETIKKTFAVVMILLAVKMLFFDKKTNPDRFKTKINSTI